MDTPGWYYKSFPGFYNVECYKILSQWKGGVRTEQQIQKVKNTQSEEREDCTCERNKKRGRESEEDLKECEDLFCLFVFLRSPMRKIAAINSY